MAEETRLRTAKPIGGTGTMTEVYMGLVWLGTSMYVAHATITGSQDGLSGAFGSAAAALPGVVAGALVTTAAIGHAASSRFKPFWLRLPIGLGVGLLFGLVCAAGIRFGYGDQAGITVFALTVGAAAVVGGAFAALPNAVLEAGLWATTFVFAFGVFIGVLQPTVVKQLGEGPDATQLYLNGASALFGLLAAFYSAQKMRREEAAAPWSLVAGALPGVFLVLAEYITRLGGSSVVDMVNGVAAGNPDLATLTDADRMRHGLIVLAVGGVVALIVALIPRRKED